MKNRVVGASVVNQSTAIWRAGSQFRGCNSTSSLVTMFGAFEMKNRVVWLCMESSYCYNIGLGASIELYCRLGASVGPGVACKVS